MLFALTSGDSCASWAGYNCSDVAQLAGWGMSKADVENLQGNCSLSCAFCEGGELEDESDEESDLVVLLLNRANCSSYGLGFQVTLNYSVLLQYRLTVQYFCTFHHRC
jgi:hypothetical protein